MFKIFEISRSRFLRIFWRGQIGPKTGAKCRSRSIFSHGGSRFPKNKAKKREDSNVFNHLPEYTFGEYRYNEKGEKLKDIVLNTIKNSPYYNKFNEKFINWPCDEDLGGFTLEFGVLKEEHKISELDRHPNAKGQQKIAEYLYDRLG